METTTHTTQTMPAVETLTLHQLMTWLATRTQSGFAQSVARQYQARGTVSEAQAAVARRMYEEAAAKAFVATMPRDEVQPGFYVGPNDIIWQVKRGSYGMCFALRYNDTTGEWDKARGAMPALLADLNAGTLRRLDATTAARVGTRTERCIVCSKALTDPDSVRAGIGPTCAAKL